MVKHWIGRFFAASFILACVGLSGCSSTPTDDYKEQSVEKLYNDAVDRMTEGEWTKASTLLDEVERQHPYSVWATKAELMQAYVNYQNSKFDAAITAADRFISLHPGNRDTPYAFYIKALCYYDQITDVARDQKDTEDALKALTELVTRYPDSRYARDARLKLDLTRDHLAGKEMEIGRFYEKAGLYVAAINRFRNVITNYERTSHVPEALSRLSECYVALGLPDEAQRSAAVLGYNFPNSPWYQDTYDLMKGARAAPAEDPSWINRMMSKLF